MKFSVRPSILLNSGGERRGEHSPREHISPLGANDVVKTCPDKRFVSNLCVHRSRLASAASRHRRKVSPIGRKVHSKDVTRNVPGKMFREYRPKYSLNPHLGAFFGNRLLLMINFLNTEHLIRYK
jgi:hypothetical protein